MPIKKLHLLYHDLPTWNILCWPSLFVYVKRAWFTHSSIRTYYFIPWLIRTGSRWFNSSSSLNANPINTAMDERGLAFICNTWDLPPQYTWIYALSWCVTYWLVVRSTLFAKQPASPKPSRNAEFLAVDPDQSLWFIKQWWFVASQTIVISNPIMSEWGSFNQLLHC